MRFDSNADTQHLVRKTLKLEPRLLRFSVVKLGHRLDQIANVGGEADEWKGFMNSRGQDRSVVNREIEETMVARSGGVENPIERSARERRRAWGSKFPDAMRQLDRGPESSHDDTKTTSDSLPTLSTQ